MVFLGERRAKQRHKAVAGELGRRAAIAVHLGEARLEEGMDELAHRLGSEALGQRRRVDHVAEQHGDLLQLAGKRAPGYQAAGGLRLRDKGLRRTRLVQARAVERCSALTAKLVLGRVGGAA